MAVTVKLMTETTVSYARLADLIHEAFAERTAQGLRFACSSMSAEELEDDMKDGFVFVALEEETSELLGTATIHIKTDRRGRKFAMHEYLAIRPGAKRSGIGTFLAQTWTDFLLEKGVSYVMSDTACKAASSVKWHRKNGFMIYGLKSFSSTNYLSYIFIKYLDDSVRKSRFVVALHFLGSALRYFFRFQ